MRRRHTRQTDPVLAGKTTQRAIRLPEVQVEAVRGAIASGLPDIHNVTDAVTDALWLWLYENKRSNGWKDQYGPVTIGSGEGEPHQYEPPKMDMADSTMTVPEGAVVVLNEEGGAVVVPEPTEKDHPYTGTADRPKWADVDMAALDGDG